ncbi:restriction endonuclease subunit S [Vibrio campbellii]|uniref:restriction endonuclease subunit S n=1 Tax=Vibrio campbellii TaxID=680 RepID=UPI001E2FBEB0|nr:restriction endonuclease subunit S [Vibrio campbellii]MCC8255291.1 restriction endonuclease subunit S [Vibrio campbellii CAIM 333]
MSCNWPLVKLSEVTSRIGDGLHGTPKYDDNGDYYFINGNNLSNGKIIINEKTKRTDESQYLKHKKDLNDRTLLVSINGTLGNIGTYQGEKVFLGKSACYLNVLPNVNKDYVMYVLTSKHFQDYIHNLATGSTIKNVGLKLIREYEFQLPDIKTQNSIANVLVSIDSKITVNQQTNQTLEEMAQAIFKSWFVDFEPVKAKMNGEQPEGMDAATASLFPEKLVESDLGLIPEGWEVMGLPSGTLFREGPGILAKDFHEKGVPLIRLAGLKNGVSLLDGCNYLDPEKVDKKWKHFLLQEGDILLSSSASLGRVAEVTKQSENSIAYTGIIGFRPIEGVTTRKYLKYFIQSQNFQRQIEAFGVGSVLKHFGPTHLKKMWILLPPISIQDKFEQLVLALDEKIQAGLEQNQSLSSLRDTLLPKLLSGEIELDVAEVNTND